MNWAEYLTFKNPIQIINDAQAALLGEVWQGAGRGFKDAVFVTLGTGVGGAILSRGHLLSGHIGRAGHIGHLCLDPDGPPGICKMPGCLEDHIGNQTIESRTAGRFASTKDLVDAAVDGDMEARRLWNRTVYLLACGLASVINIVDPEAIIIGGGISLAGEHLLGPLREALDRIEWRPTNEQVNLLPAALGRWSGAYGAAYLVLQKSQAFK